MTRVRSLRAIIVDTEAQHVSAGGTPFFTFYNVRGTLAINWRTAGYGSPASLCLLARSAAGFSYIIGESRERVNNGIVSLTWVHLRVVTGHGHLVSPRGLRVVTATLRLPTDKGWYLLGATGRVTGKRPRQQWQTHTWGFLVPRGNVTAFVLRLYRPPNYKV